MENLEVLKSLNDAVTAIKDEIRKVIVGQDTVISEILIALFADGHVLLEGVPGLAKTLMVSSLADVLDLKFNRIQFTPDLMPSDITGTDILATNSDGQRAFEYIRGPIFTNIVLADEINRTPPKTQAALLQAMQEKQVSAGITTYDLDPPFLVLATQNPIEQEGTYPLPEAQLDRFMFKISIGYPSHSEEIEIVKTTTFGERKQLKAILTADTINKIQKSVREIPVSEHVLEYAVKLVRSTRPNEEDAPDFIKKWVSWGAGPRASQFIVLAAKTKAAMDGRLTPSEKDVADVATIVLRHRILVSFAAQAEGMTSEDIITKLLGK